MEMTIESCAAHHIGDRREQQDRVALLTHPSHPGSALAVLADGMGGHSGGAVAAEQVIHRARSAFAAFSPRTQNSRDFLAETVLDAHLTIRLARYTSERDPHSTAAMLLIHDGAVHWANCGDSRVYHFREDRLAGQSEDHSYVANLVRTGKITPEAAASHPNRNVLTSCLGADREPEVAFGHLEQVLPADSFLLCSDGLWGYFEAAELGAALAANRPRQAAEQLVRAARERAAGKGDNLSLIILRFAAPTPTRARPGVGTEKAAARA